MQGNILMKLSLGFIVVGHMETPVFLKKFLGGHPGQQLKTRSSLFFCFILFFVLGSLQNAFAQNIKQNVLKTPNNKPNNTTDVSVNHNLNLNLNHKSKPKTKFAWRFRSRGLGSQDQSSQSRVYRLNLDAKILHAFNENFDTDIEPTIRFSSGFIQDYEAKGGNSSQVNLMHASLNYQAWETLKIETGVLEQTRTHNKILLDDQSFPALKIQLFKQSSSAKYYLYTQNSIVSSSSLSTRTQELEPTPTFQSLGIGFQYFPFGNLAEIQFSAFRFENLPRSLAKESSYFGNTTKKTSENDYEFAYEYGGYEITSKLDWKIIDRLSAVVSASYLQNKEAPSEFNQAYLINYGPRWNFNSTHTLFLGGRYFKIEPDAAVAALNSFELGHTNRQGYGVDMAVEFKKMNLTIAASYLDSELIYLSTEQSRQRAFVLKLETRYDFL